MESKINLTYENIIMIIPNCPNNKEVMNKDEQTEHLKLLLVFSKCDSGKVTDMKRSILGRTVKFSVNLNKSCLSTEGNLMTSVSPDKVRPRWMIGVTALNFFFFLIPNHFPLENIVGNK